MIKTILTAVAVALTSTPVLAETSGDNTAPIMSLYSTSIVNNILCRNKARSKYFEFSARDMSASDSNSQWATIGSLKAVVWCRDTQAIIAVSGFNYNSVVELRDEIVKGF